MLSGWQMKTVLQFILVPFISLICGLREKQGWSVEGRYEDLLLSGERTLTFLAEGDRQAGDSGVLQSISVQVCGTSMVTWSR